MKLMRIMLLTFACLSIITLPPVVAKDVGKYETVANSKMDNAIEAAYAGFDNAAFAVVETRVLTSEDAATRDVAILSKAPTVEAKSATIVTGSAKRYQRLCAAMPVNCKNTKMHVIRSINLHIDPGLRGC